MTVLETLQTRRSFRRFLQKEISRESLLTMLDAARLAPSGANMQPMKYIGVHRKDLVAGIFDHVKWAAYLGETGAPALEQRPMAFVVALQDLDIRSSISGVDIDAGAAIENLILAAWSEGIGSCWIGSCNKSEMSKLLELPRNLELHSVVALGYPDHACMTEEEAGTIQYHMDEDQTFHVPKRKLADIAEIR